MTKITAALISLCLSFAITPAYARHNHHHYRHHHAVRHTVATRAVIYRQVPDTADIDQRYVGLPQAVSYAPERQYTARSGMDGVVGGRRPGFPWAFCGAEASYYVFGVAKRDLWLAANWIRKFPRTSPAPGMAAARNHHVMILISHVGGSDWQVHDGNSGGHLTREHVRSISGYVIVNPHAGRYAANW